MPTINQLIAKPRHPLKARNTAPAAAVAALRVTREDPDGILAVMPSDHVIKDEQAFVAAVERAAQVARTGKLVLFGIAAEPPCW